MCWHYLGSLVPLWLEMVTANVYSYSNRSQWCNISILLGVLFSRVTCSHPRTGGHKNSLNGLRSIKSCVTASVLHITYTYLEDCEPNCWKAFCTKIIKTRIIFWKNDLIIPPIEFRGFSRIYAKEQLSYSGSSLWLNTLLWHFMLFFL